MAGRLGRFEMRESERGFAYVGVLALLAIMALSAAASLALGAVSERRASEEELLRIGMEFREAFRSYARAGPTRYPLRLEDLVEDVRSPQVRRHLRQIYIDPMTGRSQWGLVPAPGAGLAGVYSLSEARPIKVAGFELPFAQFAKAKTYKEWVFSAE